MNKTLVWHHIEVDGEEIVCTPEHPFYVLNTTAETPIVNFEGRDESQYYGQWVAAKYLKVGNKCLLSGGKTAIISKLEVEHLAEPETTYNFEVADFHTYYVGEKGILVHNDCPYQYLDEALQRQGLDKVPEGGFKETWVRDGYKYQVRAHAGNPQYTDANQIFRVARQVSPVNGSGWQYLGSNGIWYQESFLKLNNFAAMLTHITVP